MVTYIPHCGKPDFQYALLLLVSMGKINGRQTENKVADSNSRVFLISDSIYTERYMGLPTPNDNLKNYNVRKKSLYFILLCVVSFLNCCIVL